MENLNAEQVKKALECCTLGDCYPCPYGNIGAGCRDKMSEDALALINELTEENEGMTSTIKILVNNNADLEFELAQTYDLLEESKADTVRKMQERLKAASHIESTITGYRYSVVDVAEIDQIAKEMLEDGE